ncbi:hypothetical protein IG631_23222 [Alternaria alternata]|nr:hypothetical protein IG631_23222 [Alternaria alternata]
MKPSPSAGDKSLLAKFASRFLAWEAPAHRDALRGDFDRSMGKCLARSVGGGNSRGGQTDASSGPPWLSLNSIGSGMGQDMVGCGVV